MATQDRYKRNQEFLYIKGAREHNLQNIDVQIPRDTLTVITGLSGSGKSSLAFDTIYAEGQRRYVESLSSYARQFLGLMEKPDVDFIEGLSPAISIEQKRHRQEPTLDSRYGHRNLRLSPPALRAGRRTPLRQMRPADHTADGRADCRFGARFRRGHPPDGARSAGARQKRRTQRDYRRGQSARASCDCGSTARLSNPTPISASTKRRSTRSKRSSTALSSKPNQSAGWPIRSRPR